MLGPWTGEECRIAHERDDSRRDPLYLGIATDVDLLAPEMEKRQSGVMYDAFLTRQSWN